MLSGSRPSAPDCTGGADDKSRPADRAQRVGALLIPAAVARGYVHTPRDGSASRFV